MYKRIIILLIFAFGCWIGLFAQKNNTLSSIDKIMLKIPDSLTTSTQRLASFINSNYSNQNDKSRAVFIWIAKNIQYDLDNMFAINFYQNTDEVIDIVLKTRKGICMHFAELFSDVANKVGIKSYVVSGYTKQNGFVEYIPHAWCVANIDSSWYMFDPTWGSGYVENSHFIKTINNFYFKALPTKIIKSHMPFDPMWQFLNRIITCQEFYDGKLQENAKKPYFNFRDTLLCYEKQSELERLISSSNRIEKNGVKSSLVFEKLEHNKRQIDYYQKQIEYKNNKLIADQFNSAANSYNIGVNSLNIFISYKNKQFTPLKPDSEITQMIDTVEASFKLSREQLSNIVNPDTNTLSMITQLNKSIDNSYENLNEQKAFVETYCKTKKFNRRALFYKK
ncbi:MAG: hypothetical protein HGB12_08010 [Bacteroidetes bacterium]|nr:hypothetical protein [Bacteroidota bacterium]